MRAAMIGLVLSAVLARPASAYDAYDPANCNGAGDDKRALSVSKVTAHPRVHFVKSPYDDDFTASTCPAATTACRKKDYLLTGDLVRRDADGWSARSDATTVLATMYARPPAARTATAATMMTPAVIGSMGPAVRLAVSEAVCAAAARRGLPPDRQTPR